MISGLVVRVKSTDCPNDGLSSVGHDPFVLIVLSPKRPLVGEHYIIVDQGGVEQPDVVCSSRGQGVLTDPFTSRALALGSDVMVVNEAFTGCPIEPTYSYIRADHLCLFRIATRAEGDILSVICDLNTILIT